MDKEIKHKLPKVYIVVDCGRVSEVYSAEDIDVEVLDFDESDISEEERDELNEKYTTIQETLKCLYLC